MTNTAVGVAQVRGPGDPPPPRARWRRPMAIGLGVLAVLLVGVLVAPWLLPGGDAETPPPAGTSAPAASPGVAVSKDGEVPTRWPDATNTGVPDGVTLTKVESLDLVTDGEVVTGLDIDGCVDVKAKNVTIRQSRITCDRKTWAVRTYDTTRNLVLEDVEIDGSGVNSTAVCCDNYTLRRVEVRNVIDGPRLGNNTAVVDSWIHDLARGDNSHNDALQTTGGVSIVVKHNRLDLYDKATSDPFNACIMVGSTTSPLVRDLVFEDNYCNGGNYSVGIRDDLKAQSVTFRRNVFGRDFRYGVVARPDHPGITWTDTNLWADTRKPVLDE
ncbi:hypothetical protein [Asanoa iriomotensis]|uniref:Parallel beta helix pectate lyase-like protein n=1 Tax=Asanoa iriomotensis TaxID=234613 RepID=A0ABQ4BWH2_9ACTN|nr:hypothetical protein [Asanoa iriomotensis]GIF54889.1 hypothetical protein Air01nite_09840 [Asanoa iriomotensis]